MPFNRGQKDDRVRKKLGRALSQFFGRSKGRAGSPSPVSRKQNPPQPAPSLTIPPPVQPPILTPTPQSTALGPTAAAQPTLPSSLPSAPTRSQSLIGRKKDVNTQPPVSTPTRPSAAPGPAAVTQQSSASGSVRSAPTRSQSSIPGKVDVNLKPPLPTQNRRSTAPPRRSTAVQPSTSGSVLTTPTRSQSFIYGKMDLNIPKSRLPPTLTDPTTASTSVAPSSTSANAISEAESHKQAGNAAVVSGRFDDAAREYTKALRLDPNNALCLSDRSYAYLCSSRLHDARNDAEKAVRLNPSLSVGWSRLGQANMRLASYAGAKTTFERALQLQGDGPESDVTRKDLADTTRSLEIQQGRPIPAKTPSRPASSFPASPPLRSNTTIPTRSPPYSTSSRTSLPPPSTATPFGSGSPVRPTWSTLVPPAPSTTSGATSEAERHKTLGDHAIASGDYQKAIDEYSRAIQLAPASAIYLADRSSAEFSLTRYHSALIDAERAVAIDPSYWKGWSRLGAAHKALGEYSDAKTAYNQALLAQRGGAGVEDTIKDLVEVTRLLAEKTDGADTLTSRSTITTGSLAGTSLRPPIPTSPPVSSAFVPTSSSASASGRSAAASRAIPLSSPGPAPASQGPSVSTTSAQPAVNSPAVLNPSASTASAPSATGSLEPNNRLSESARKAEHHKTLGNDAVSERNFDKAVEEYTRAIQLDPSNAVYLANRSYAYLALSRHIDARNDAEKSVVVDPAYWKGWSRLGSAHKALEQYSDAKTAYEQALRVLGGSGSGAEVTKRDLAEVIHILNERNSAPVASTSRVPATNNPVVHMAAPTAPDNPPQRASTAAPAQSTSFIPVTPQPVSPASVPGWSDITSQIPRRTPAPVSAPARSTSVPVSQSPPASRSAHTTQGIPTLVNPAVDPPPAYRPGELSSPDPVVAAVAGQELDRELNELERKIAARNAGALSINSLTMNALVSFFVSLIGRESQYTWDEDLDLVKIAHPSFALYYAEELKGSTLHNVDPELHRRFAGLIPGTVTITGFSELVAEHFRTTTPRTVTTLSSTGVLPLVSGKQILARIDRLRIGLEFTDQEASMALREFLGPDRTIWVNPADRFKLSNQIMDLCMALNRRDVCLDFRDTSSIALLALASPPAGMGIWNFLYQIVLGYELHLRLEKNSDSWYSGVNDKVSANMLISKQWINNVDMYIEGADSNLKMRSRVQARQIEGLLQFAEIMKWPHLSEMRDYVENAYVDLLGGKTVKVDLWDWLFGIMLPGRLFSFKIMSVLVTATPSLSSHGTAPNVNSGFNLDGRSWWRCRTVLGSVLAGLRGVRSACGWVGPCPGMTDAPAKPWIRIRARPVEFLRGTITDTLGNIDDASDNDSGEEDSRASRRLFNPQAGETMFDVIQDLGDMSRWSEPNPPAKVNQSCSVSKIALKALPLETTGNIDLNDAGTEYQASVTFRFTGIAGTSDITYTLYTNPAFISAHPCVGTHVVHRREMSRYQDNVVSVKDLKSLEGSGGRKVLVINAQCEGGEAVARAWCAERGKHAVVRRGKGTCFTCSVSMAGRDGLGVGVLIWS